MTTRPRPLRTGHVVAAVVAVLGLAGAWHALQPALGVPLPTEANQPEERMQDFRDALYYPIREFLAGGIPYDPAAMFANWPVRQDFNLYQPYHLVLHLPFALPGYRVGAIAFAAASLALLVALAAMAGREVRVRVPGSAVVATVVLAALLVISQVGKAQLFVGQVNPLVAVGAAAAVALRVRNPRWAAVALAVAWLKPQFGLPLAVLLAARGSRGVALRGTAIAAAASLPVVVLLVVRAGGVGAFLDIVAANLTHARGTDYGAVDSMTAQRVDVAAVFYRVTGWLPPAAELAAVLAVLTVTALLARRLDRGGDPDRADSAKVDSGRLDSDRAALGDLLVLVGVVVAVVHQPGDVLIAFPAMAAAAAVWWRNRREPTGRPLGRLLGWALLALSVPYAHLYFVDRAVAGLLGERWAVTVDGVAVVVCWVLLAVLARRETASAVARS
ncbi:glycosyltransferase 87 family protein [Actinokineospora sp. 24-640]